MELSILIVSYNTRQLTLQTLQSIIDSLAADPNLKDQTEVIVIDNHSSDDSVAALKKLRQTFPLPLTIIENAENLGFAQANNLGLEQASGTYILLLNSDTVVQPGALTELIVSFRTHPPHTTTAVTLVHNQPTDRLGIVAATLLNPDGSLQPQGGSFPSLLSLAVQMFFLDDLPLLGQLLPSIQHTGRNQHQQNNETDLIPQDWVGGTAMLAKREVFAEIGPLDPAIFMYAEDIEFCLRAAHHHWDCAIQPKAKIIHLQNASGSSEKAIVGEMTGLLYLWSKHKPAWQQPFARALLRLGAQLRVFVFGTMIKDKPKAASYRQALQALAHT